MLTCGFMTNREILLFGQDYLGKVESGGRSGCLYSGNLHGGVPIEPAWKFTYRYGNFGAVYDGY